MTASTRIVLKNIYASYVSVFEPRPKMSGDGMEYSMMVVVPKDHPQLEELKGSVIKVAKEAFPKMKPAQLKLGLRDADAEGKDNENMQNTMFINARSDRAPQVISRSKKIITDPDQFYSGCLVNVALSIFSYDVNGSRGVSARLNAIQVMEQGARWDGRVSAIDIFADESGGEEDGFGGFDEPAKETVSADAESGGAEEDEFQWN